MIYPSYTIPTTIATPVTNSNTSFLLLNTEFHNQTSLTGFVLYAATNGSINIQVEKFILILNSYQQKIII